MSVLVYTVAVEGEKDPQVFKTVCWFVPSVYNS